MTGPGHYQHAEMLLDMASDEEAGSEMEISRLRAAQVHATLALAAATGLRGIQNSGATGETLDYADWMEATQ